GPDVRPADARVRRVAARARADDQRDGNDPLRLLRERWVSARRLHLADHGRRHERGGARGDRARRWLRRLQEAVKLALSPEERQLQEEVRSFLGEHCPDPAEIPHPLAERMAYLRRWQARCYEAGYVGRAWPAEFGGGGRPTAEQIVVDQELAAAGAPEFPSVVGLDVLGPALLEFGTDEQRTRYVQPILSAEELWAQGFS